MDPMPRPLRFLATCLTALALTGCESGLFDDFDGLEPPSFGKRKEKRENRRPTDRPPTETAQTDPPVSGWEPVAPDGAPPPDAPPPATGWEPVDAGMPPPPPPPAPGTYQPAVPKATGGVVGLPPGHQAAGASDADPLYGTFVGTTPPALGADGRWLVPGVANTLAGLRGQVVFLMFAFQTCPSCAQITPYLKQWHDMYGPQGLSVVYVNNGRMSSEADALQAIGEQGLRFAYLHDPQGSSLHAFSIRAFPTAYVIDRAGKVVWEGTPLAVEAQVQELLVGLLATK